MAQKKISLLFPVILSNPFAKTAVSKSRDGHVYFQFLKFLCVCIFSKKEGWPQSK